MSAPNKNVSSQLGNQFNLNTSVRSYYLVYYKNKIYSLLHLSIFFTQSQIS